jgi:hypothetical protein
LLLLPPALPLSSSLGIGSAVVGSSSLPLSSPETDPEPD